MALNVKDKKKKNIDIVLLYKNIKYSIELLSNERFKDVSKGKLKEGTFLEHCVRYGDVSKKNWSFE
jgi:hypothetical protein